MKLYEEKRTEQGRTNTHYRLAIVLTLVLKGDYHSCGDDRT